MEKICMNLEGKWNDYIGVQKEVPDVLSGEHSLKKIVENAELVEDNMPDYHHKDGYTFAYLVAKIMIDEDVVNIRITVKKKIAVNWFWIHNIDELTSQK